MERKLISSGSPYERPTGFSRAVRVGDRVLVAGTAPVGAEEAGFEAQADRCFEVIEAALREAGASLGDVVRTRMYLTRSEDQDAMARAHGARFADVRPAATMVIVKELLDPRWLVEIEAEAIVGSGRPG